MFKNRKKICFCFNLLFIVIFLIKCINVAVLILMFSFIKVKLSHGAILLENFLQTFVYKFQNVIFFLYFQVKLSTKKLTFLAQNVNVEIFQRIRFSTFSKKM